MKGKNEAFISMGIFILCICLGVVIVFAGVFWGLDWERHDLRSFNKTNNTEITLDEWRNYRREIIDAYPWEPPVGE